MCTKKNHQLLSSIKKDAHKRKLVLFFCLTVYICEISYHIDSKPVTTRDRFSSRGAANRTNIASCAVYRIWWGRRLRRRCTSASRTWRSRRTAAPCTCTSCRARPPTDTVYAHTRPSINQSINQSIIHAVFVHHLHRRRVNSLARSLNASVVSRPSLIYCHVSWTRTKDIRLPPTSAPPDLTNVS